MTIAHKEIEAWFQDRPKWLQDAARRLVKNGTLSEKDYEDLINACITEATGQAVTFSGLPPDSLSVVDTAIPLRLDSIAEVQGINALSPSKPLTFDKSQLCIVYGRNGAGKSGYVRLLKHVCGARQPGELLGNVFGPANQPKSAKFTFTKDTQTKTTQWSNAPISELQGVEIYDTACGLVYVNEENEVAFEPWLLRLFTELTKVCAVLSAKIKKLIADNVSKKPIFPADYVGTASAVWYANLSVNATKEEVEGQTEWKVDHETQLTEISRRLAEPNPAAKAVALRRQRAIVLDLLTDLKEHTESLSEVRCNTYLQIKADATVKRKAADEDAKKVFEKAPLSGIGSETWRALWEAARQYSEEYAYNGRLFPNTDEDARCVLCQQKMVGESRERFLTFESFVRGELQRLASEGEKALQKSQDTFADMPTSDLLSIKMEAAGIVDETTVASIIEFATMLEDRRKTCLSANTANEISSLPGRETLIPFVQIARKLEKQARSFDNDAKNQNRPQIEQTKKELSARKWLCDQRTAIDAEITRLKTVYLLEQADRLTNTKALSQRKSLLADTLITDAYKNRFKNELKVLGASNVAVEINKSRAEVGRVYHCLSLRNATAIVQTSEILSEGEFRIASLAAFLADTEGCGASTPFIFDDPISSLDHIFEKTMAKRLVALSRSRQVIIFTHRLSLLGWLEKYAKKEKIAHQLVCLSQYQTGEIVDQPIEFKKTDAAVNTLANQRLAEARKAFGAGDEYYNIFAKSMCQDIRILIERIVEADLIDEIVKRFNPEVNTKGKIYHLSKITAEDCKFIDDYMTKYSQYEHSQSEESPVSLPNPDELEKDLKAIAGFIQSVKNRKNI